MSADGVYPIPHKRYQGRRWRIYWYWNNKQYSIATDFGNKNMQAGISNDLRLLSAALAKDHPDFPEKYADKPAVVAYVKERYPETIKLKSVIPDNDTILAEYNRQRKNECSKEWARNTAVRLKEMSDKADGILKVPPALAQSHLSDILEKNCPATRNRCLSVYNKFFKWAKRNTYVTANPFDGLPIMKEEVADTIIHCTRPERAKIINLARKSNFPDWIAVPIAFYTGMRMSEIMNMKWNDIEWKTSQIVIPKTKAKKRRTTPLNSKLAAMLRLVPREKRGEYVVPIVEGAKSRRDRAQTLMKHLKKLAVAEKVRVEAKYFGWNVWRHTFATMLAQAGETLDTISSWMGNTRSVCERHYAQFMPRDAHAKGIEKL